MASLSTHVLDTAGGGARTGVGVTVHDATGTVVGAGVTDAEGRIVDLAAHLDVGPYRIEWASDRGFVSAVAITVEIGEDRHYHVPLLVSPVSAVVYLGA